MPPASWAVAIATNDVAALSASAYPGYTYHFRNFLDANEVETGAKLFVALSWPEDKRPHKNNRMHVAATGMMAKTAVNTGSS